MDHAVVAERAAQLEQHFPLGAFTVLDYRLAQIVQRGGGVAVIDADHPVDGFDLIVHRPDPAHHFDLSGIVFDHRADRFDVRLMRGAKLPFQLVEVRQDRPGALVEDPDLFAAAQQVVLEGMDHAAEAEISDDLVHRDHVGVGLPFDHVDLAVQLADQCVQAERGGGERHRANETDDRSQVGKGFECERFHGHARPSKKSTP